MQDIKQREESTSSWSERFDKEFWECDSIVFANQRKKNLVKSFVSKELELERQKAREEGYKQGYRDASYLSSPSKQ